MKIRDYRLIKEMGLNHAQELELIDIAIKEEVFEEFSKIAEKMNLTFEDTVWYQKVKEKVLK